jgi:hypothetical protein
MGGYFTPELQLSPSFVGQSKSQSQTDSERLAALHAQHVNDFEAASNAWEAALPSATTAEFRIERFGARKRTVDAMDLATIPNNVPPRSTASSRQRGRCAEAANREPIDRPEDNADENTQQHDFGQRS